MVVLLALYSFRGKRDSASNATPGEYVAWYKNGSGDLYQHSLDDAEATEYMRTALADVVTRRDKAIPLEKQKEIARLFHDLEIWPNMWWMGIRTQKNPCDMWMMQQIIYEVRPDFIVEAGTFRGGSALYFAHMFEGMGLHESKVMTIDIVDNCAEARKLPIWNKYVEFIHGSSTAARIVDAVRNRVRGRTCMVVLDSDHSYQHVIQELRHYSALVTLDSYLVVEDTNLDGVPILEDYDGPTKAVREFLESDGGKNFVQDDIREAMVLTFNPGGWLRRIAASTDVNDDHPGEAIQASVKRQTTGFRAADGDPK